MSSAWSASRRSSWVRRFNALGHDALTVILVMVIAAALAGLLLGSTSLGGPPGFGLDRWPPVP
jgi:hypothetical protein